MRSSETAGPFVLSPDVERDVVVLAEGKDEADLARHLLKDRKDVVQIYDCQGRDNIPRLIPLVVRAERFRQSGRAVAVITDADGDVGGTFRWACALLASSGLPVPDAAEHVARAGRRSAGVFVTPGGGATGAIEALYLSLADPLRVALADAYISDVESAGFPRGLRYPTKARLQAVLAGLHKSPRRPGDALQVPGFVVDRTPLEPLREFLTLVITAPAGPEDPT